MTDKEKIKNLTKDLHLARVCIRELKESKKDMKAFYQAEIRNYQDKIKELISDATD